MQQTLGCRELQPGAHIIMSLIFRGIPSPLHGREQAQQDMILYNSQ
jgi:hypothetical protein